MLMSNYILNMSEEFLQTSFIYINIDNYVFIGNWKCKIVSCTFVKHHVVVQRVWRFVTLSSLTSLCCLKICIATKNLYFVSIVELIRLCRCCTKKHDTISKRKKIVCLNRVVGRTIGWNIFLYRVTLKHSNDDRYDTFCIKQTIGYHMHFVYEYRTHIMNGIDYIYKEYTQEKAKKILYENIMFSICYKIDNYTLVDRSIYTTSRHAPYFYGWHTHTKNGIDYIDKKNTPEIKRSLLNNKTPYSVGCRLHKTIRNTHQTFLLNAYNPKARLRNTSCWLHDIKELLQRTAIYVASRLILPTKNWQVIQLRLLIFLLLWTPINSASYQNIKYSTNLIKTKYGPLRGILLYSNPIVEAFLGVPYASPPVGSLRYMPPVTPSTWKATRLADNFSPVCPQAFPRAKYGYDSTAEHSRRRLSQLRRLLPLLSNQSEDCLYLNLYVPRSEDSVEPSGTLKATIVYIHGESYEWNSGNPYDGSVLAAEGNVILVTINFRLGVLGFLKTGAKGSAQGNFGLMDLVAALHWLTENLSAFHGDPSQITLMGHGTGAALANILVVSPVASDLIHRVILLSGSALSPWAIQREPLAVKRVVAEQTGCRLNVLTEDLAPCLRTKSVSELLEIVQENPRFLPGYAPFVDGTVIINPNTIHLRFPELPSGSAITSTNGIEFANFPTRQLLFGLTSYESFNDLSAQDLEFGFNETRRDRILRTYVRNIFHIHLKEIYSALKNEYTDWEHTPRNPLGYRDTILELLSDGHTAAPLVRLGYLHNLLKGKSYFLHFRHQSGEREFPQRGGSVRGEDVPFTFGLPLSPLFSTNYTEDDIQISRILVRYLTNFAKTGDPNILKNTNEMSLYKNTNARKLTSMNQAPTLGEQLPLKNNLIRRLFRSSTNYSERAVVNSGDESDEYNNNWNAFLRPLADKQSIDSEEHNDGDDDDITRDESEKALLKLENWETYDAINQIYMEIGCNVAKRSHYRGHKLSMWLSLIPQLHSPDDSAYLPMRHHHFTEVKPEYYDGKVRDAVSMLPKLITIAKTTTKPHKTESNAVSFVQTVPTECPPNMTVMPPVAATHPQRNQMNPSTQKDSAIQSDNSQLDTNSTALKITVCVGCFLLLLNVFIFSAIYYQREKHANLNKQRDTAADTSSNSPLPSLDDQFMQQKSLTSLRAEHSSSTSNINCSESNTFEKHNCYEKQACTKKKCILVDVSRSDLQMKECSYASPRGSTSGSIQRSTTPETYKEMLNENVTATATFSSQPSSLSDSSSITTISCLQMRKNSSTSTCAPETQEIGTTVDEADLEFSALLMEQPSAPTRSIGFQQAGILRQQASSINHGSAKKRVQIQEISV
ncbi:neuroligin-1 isoform X2 [Culex quinquefasciatus]|uniref:neuroligin-1 isoform X2 n=1 Tax=Culex quinquefasciatus TaxID=7176 RepID=UPI0018E2FEFD|nr:neuroligin-1 isoform X2 [Culex quinquefasciatus]